MTKMHGQQDSAPSTLATINARMSATILSEPAQPYREGSYALRAVHTTGRRSGERRTTPLGVVQLDGRLYLVSSDRGRDWVRNLDADPSCVVATASGADDHTAVRASPAEAAPVVSAYLQQLRQMPWALADFPVAPDAGLDEIAATMDSMAVLRLDPPKGLTTT